MQAAIYDTPIFIDSKTEVQNPVSGEVAVTWASISGTRPIFANFEDEVPSRSEAIRQRVPVNTRRSVVRFPFRAGIDSSMRVRVSRGFGEEVFQIVGGPAIVGERREAVEIVVESYSS